MGKSPEYVKKQGTINPFRNAMKKFTLLELLIVIAILGILVTMLLPSLRNSKKVALSAVCMSNLNQLGKCSIRFAVDHNRRVPAAGANLPYTNSSWWTASLNGGGYLQWTEDAMTCPSLPFEGDWSSENYVTYGAPREFNWRNPRIGEIEPPDAPYFGFDIALVDSPEEFFWYGDSAKLAGGVLFQWQTYEYQYKNRGRASALRIHTRHSNKANIWFVDGHVSSNSIGSLKKLEVDYIFTEEGSAIGL